MSSHRTGRVLVILALVCMGPACATSQRSTPQRRPVADGDVSDLRDDIAQAQARTQLAAARRAGDKGDWRTAARLAKAVYDSGELEIESGLLLAEAYAERDSHRQRLEIYDKLRESHPHAVDQKDYVDALAFAIGEMRTRDRQERLELRLKLARLAPSLPAGSIEAIRREMYALARRKRRRGEWDEVLRLTRELESSAPAAERPLVSRERQELEELRAFALYASGQRERGRRALRKLADGATARRVSDVAGFLRKHGDDQAAIDVLQNALNRASAAPDNDRLELYLGLAEAMLDSEQPALQARGDRLVQYYVQVGVATTREVRHDNIYRSGLRLAQGYQRDALYDRLLRQALRDGQISRYRLERLVRRMAQRGQTKQAVALIEQYVDASLRRPSNPGDIFAAAARMASTIGETKKAYAYMQRALEASASERDQSQRSLNLAQFALQMGDKHKALRAVEHYVDIVGENTGGLRRAASFLERHGWKDEALELLERAHKAEPGNWRTTRSLLRMLRDMKHAERVEEVLLAAIEHGASSQYGRRRLSRMVRYYLDGEAALRAYLSLGKQGSTDSLVDAAQLAVELRRPQMYDAAAAALLEREGDDARWLAKLWRILEPSPYDQRKNKLLEELVSKSKPNTYNTYRIALTHQYVERGEDSEAFALWQGGGDELRFDQDRWRRFDTKLRRHLLNQFHQRFPSDEAPASMLLLVGDLYYGLSKEPPAELVEEVSVDSLEVRAKNYYGRSLAKARGGASDWARAASFFERRDMFDLAEKAHMAAVHLEPSNEHYWGDYANFLLERGRVQAAKQVFYRHLQQSPARGQTAVRVGDDFARRGFDAQAEEFYRMALAYEGSHEMTEYAHKSIQEDVGRELGQMYLRQGRVDDFLELTSDFYAKYTGSHPYLTAHDRRIDLHGLRSNGLWQAYLDRIERLPLQSPQLRRERDDYAHVLWFVGRRQDAWAQFEKMYDRDASDSSSWLRTARFLEGRGGETLAATAYDRAVRFGSRYDRYGALVARAGYLVRQGHFEAAIADYFAAASVGKGYADRVYAEMLSAFDAAGRAAMARRAARADDSPLRDVATRIEPLDDVPDGKVEHVVDWANKTLANGAHFPNIVRELRNAGRIDAVGKMAVHLIEQDDMKWAGWLVENFYDDLASADQLPAIIEALDGRRRAGSPDVLQVLVAHAVEAGDDARALHYLARDGHWASSETIQALQRRLALQRGVAVPSDYFTPYLDPLEMLRFGLGQQFLRSARTKIDIKPWSRNLSRPYVAALLDTHGPGATVESLRAQAEAVAQIDEPGARRRGVDEIVEGLAVLASSGFRAEVRAMSAQLPAAVRSEDSFRRFSARLDTVDNHVPDLPGESWSQVYPWIRRLVLAGQYRRAEQALRRILASLCGEPGAAGPPAAIGPSRRNRSHRRDVLRWMISLYALTDDQDAVREAAERWKETVGRDVDSLEDLVEVLADRGLYPEAARVARQAARDYPTDDLLEAAIFVAGQLGDTEAVEEFFPAYWRQEGTQGRTFGRRGVDKVATKFDPESAQTVLAFHRRSQPGSVEPQIAEIVVAFRAGQVHRGRALIEAFLATQHGQDEVVDSLAGSLNKAGLFVETARIVAPSVDVDTLSRKTLERLARACAEVGLDAQAMSIIEVILGRSDRPGYVALGLAHPQIVDGHVGLAAKLVERAFEADYKTSRAYLDRGLIRLARGEDGAEADLKRGLDGRAYDPRLLEDVATVALRAGRYETAKRYLSRLLRVPQGYPMQSENPVYRVVSALRTSGRARWGVGFLEAAMPSIFEGAYLVDDDDWTALLGALLTDAGMLERAEHWFARASQYDRLADDHPTHLDEYTLGRAINLAFNGGEPQRAIAMSKRAIFLSGEADPLALVALAVAQYRHGQVDAAVASYRNAVAAGFEDMRQVPVAEHLGELIERGPSHLDRHVRPPHSRPTRSDLLINRARHRRHRRQPPITF